MIPRYQPGEPTPPSYRPNGSLYLDGGDTAWRDFFPSQDVRWVRFMLWTRVRVFFCSSRMMLTSGRQSNADPYIFIFEAPHGVFVAALQDEVKAVLGVPEDREDVRWTRWCRDKCDWDVTLGVGTILPLEWNEHTVVGRLEGVTNCRGLGKAIHWAEHGLPSPMGMTMLGEDLVRYYLSLVAPVEDLSDEDKGCDVAEDDDVAKDDDVAEDDDGTTDTEADKASALEQGGKRAFNSEEEGSALVAGPSKKRRRINVLTRPARAHTASQNALSPVPNQEQEGARRGAERRRVGAPADIIDLTDL